MSTETHISQNRGEVGHPFRLTAARDHGHGTGVQRISSLSGAFMPILFMALLALLAFLVIGVLLCAAVISESRQREKAERQRSSTTLPKPQERVDELELSHR